MLKNIFYVIIFYSLNLYSYEISEVVINSKNSVDDFKYHNGNIYFLNSGFLNHQFNLIKFDGKISENITIEDTDNCKKEEFLSFSDSQINFYNDEIWVSGKNYLYQYYDNSWHCHKFENEKYKSITLGNFIFDNNSVIWGFADARTPNKSLFYKFQNNAFEILLEGRVGEFNSSVNSSNFLLKDQKIIFPKNRFGDNDTFNNPQLDSNNIIVYDGVSYKGYPLIVSDYSEWTKIINFMMFNNNENIVIGTNDILLSNDSLSMNYGAGLSEMDIEGNCYVYDSTNGLPYNYQLNCYERFYDMVLDSDGNYWVTSSASNILLVTPKKNVVKINWKTILDNSIFYKLNTSVSDSIVNLGLSNLLENNPVFSSFQKIEIDEKGNIYILLNYGLLKYTPLPASVNYDNYDDFIVYPNPVLSGNTINIESNDNLIGNIQLVDIQGKKVYSQDYNGSKKITIDLPNNFNSGAYYIIINSDNIITTKKIIINR